MRCIFAIIQAKRNQAASETAANEAESNAGDIGDRRGLGVDFGESVEAAVGTLHVLGVSGGETDHA